jgi:proteasome lid subunit RPN8/RPN11
MKGVQFMQITPEAMEIIFRYAELAKKSEIAGFAKMNKNKLIYEVLPIPKQEVTGGTVNIDEEFMLPFIHRSDVHEIVVNWHSHGNGSVFWSSTDEENIETLGKFMKYLISIVVNNKRDYKARIDYFYPIHVHADIKLDVHIPIPKNIATTMEEDVQKMLFFPKPKIIIPQSKPDNKRRDFEFETRYPVPTYYRNKYLQEDDAPPINSQEDLYPFEDLLGGNKK